jgi:hypothetical protein
VKVSKLLFFLLLGGVGVLVAAELMVRLFFPQPLDPGRKFIFENEIAGLKAKVEFASDANQIRGFDSVKAKPSGALRILCVGGVSTSTMLQNEEDTWWGQLGAALEKSLDREVQIGCVVAPASHGIVGGGQWTDHLLAEIDGVDLVIAMYGRSAVLGPGSRYSFDPQAIQKINFETRGGLGKSLAEVSHLVRMARNARIKSKRNEQQRVYGKANFLRDRLEAAGNAYRSLTATTASPPRPSDPLVEYLYGVGILYEDTKRHGVKLCLVGEPTVFSALMGSDVAETLHTSVHVGPGDQEFARPLPGWVDSELARYYEAANRFCSDAGVSFLNLQGVILPTRANFFTESTFTDQGASEVAKQLQPVVESSLE